jgi:hypothetical protein
MTPNTVMRPGNPIVPSGAVVDETKVQAHLRDLGHDLEKGASAWIVPKFLGISLTSTIFTVVVPAFLSGDLGGIVDRSTPLFWARWLLPTILGAPSVVAMYFRNRRRVARGAAPLAERIQREWNRMTGRGWVGRTLAVGAGMAVFIGGSVGLLLSTQFPLSDLPGGSRWLAFFGFLGMTALWTFPAAFGIRALSMKNHRLFLREGPGRPIPR